uniref:Uncharacterized protein n=1 Tax=Anguilla anguilla TaxID=7936 RepID=A0A0E9XXV3_ANGAN
METQLKLHSNIMTNLSNHKNSMYSNKT